MSKFYLSAILGITFLAVPAFASAQTHGSHDQQETHDSGDTSGNHTSKESHMSKSKHDSKSNHDARNTHGSDDEESNHSRHDGAAGQSSNPVVTAFEAASATMHRNMDIDLTGDADVDFVRGMIPHHQGAIDMAKIQLEHGKDPEIRKMAEAVISTQENEITKMKSWLAEKGL